MMDLRNRVALVTGGATGIGQATVRRLASSGVAAVAINYRSARVEAEALAGEVSQLGVDALCVYADLKHDGQIRRMVREVGDRFGRLDILVNNAGVTEWVPITDLEGLSDEMWR